MRYSILSNIWNTTCYEKNNDNTCYVGFIGLLFWLNHLDYGKFTCERYPGSIDYIQQDMEVEWLIDAIWQLMCVEKLYMWHCMFITLDAKLEPTIFLTAYGYAFELCNGVLMTAKHHWFLSLTYVCLSYKPVAYLGLEKLF